MIFVRVIINTQVVNYYKLVMHFNHSHYFNKDLHVIVQHFAGATASEWDKIAQCRALFAYRAQLPCDLSFKTG